MLSLAIMSTLLIGAGCAMLTYRHATAIKADLAAVKAAVNAIGLNVRK
jgi:hypothetical protein